MRKLQNILLANNHHRVSYTLLGLFGGMLTSAFTLDSVPPHKSGAFTAVTVCCVYCAG